MEFGVQLASMEMAQAADQVGYDFICSPDHFVSEGPERQSDPRTILYDAIVVAGAVAEATKKIRVGHLECCATCFGIRSSPPKSCRGRPYEQWAPAGGAGNRMDPDEIRHDQHAVPPDRRAVEDAGRGADLHLFALDQRPHHLQR
jgi:Luciferase-like monooxygenase